MGWALVKTRLLALGNDLWYLLVSLPQEIQEPFFLTFHWH